MLAFKKILVPVDGSKGAKKALAYAGYLAELCHGSVGILHVVNLSAEMAAVGSISTGGYIPDRVLEDVQESGRLIIAKALKQLPSTVAAEGFMEIGSPSEIVVEFCVEKGYDLIVIGSRGLGAIKGLVLGSVSNYVVHRAPCPVMVIK